MSVPSDLSSIILNAPTDGTPISMPSANNSLLFYTMHTAARPHFTRRMANPAPQQAEK